MIGLANINMAIYLVSTLKERLQKAMEGPPKVSQAELAKAVGVKPASVNGWITGSTKNIVGKHLFLAAEYLKVEAKWLACGEGPMRPTSYNADKKRYAIIEHVMHAPEDKLDKIEGDVIQICQPTEKYNGKK